MVIPSPDFLFLFLLKLRTHTHKTKPACYIIKKPESTKPSDLYTSCGEKLPDHDEELPLQTPSMNVNK